NFSVYYLVIIRKFKQIIKIEELHWYLGIFVIAVIAIGTDLNIEGNMNSQLDIWHHTAFQVGTFISSTGFATYDFDTWPEFSKMILLVVAFIGACAGSTGGGFKVSRIIILVKSAVKEFGTTLHPNSVKTVKMDGKTVKSETIRSVHSYLSIFIFIYLVSVLIISVDGFDFETNFTAVLATINNMGPGLNLVGPTKNFYDFSILSKLVLIFDMLAGRLELLPLLFLFDKSCWKSK
ncbi:MAG: TrkH family potassium uptake protein, partial [Clostridia bacterium]|nr:TrkH family potassium uptake protein [Clostridia bacterium]